MVLVHDNSKICDPLAVVMTELCALQPSGFDFLVFSPQELQGYLWPKQAVVDRLPIRHYMMRLFVPTST
jgi:hypothetical protein